MVRLRFLCLLLLFAVDAAAQAEPDSLARIVAERLEQSEAPACIAVGLVAETTQTSFGCSAGAGRIVPDAKSIFEIGSITRGFTGLVLADWGRKGELSMEDTAAKYSPADAKLPDRGGVAITLRDIVTQPSGLPRMPPIFKPANPRNPYADFDASALYNALAHTEATNQEGRYEYSSFGFMWLSEILSRRGANGYEALLRERILDPLGMEDTRLSLSPDQLRRFVPGHDALYNVVPHWDNAAELAGVGGLRASLGDMLKLAAALAGRVKTPLDETIELALKPMRPSMPGTSTGFAWITRERGDIRIQFHGGGTFGFRSMIAVNPATRTAAVVLVDSFTSFDDLAVHVVDSQFPLMRKRVGLFTDAAMRNEYVGRYVLTPKLTLTVFVDGDRLMTQGTGQRAIEIAREGPDTFFPYVVPARLRFSRASDGTVDGLTLEQGGVELQG